MYVKITNGAVDQFPYTVGDLRRDNSNTSFPKRPSDELLADWGVYPVAIEDEPSYNQATHNALVNQIPSLVGSVWTLEWSVVPKTDEEIQAYEDAISSENRITRDGKLAETDFYALSDVTMPAEMSTYRQALRDITTHANWPHLNDDDWPTKP